MSFELLFVCLIDNYLKFKTQFRFIFHVCRCVNESTFCYIPVSLVLLVLILFQILKWIRFKVFDPIVGHLSFNRYRTKTRFNAVTISSCMNFHDLSK